MDDWEGVGEDCDGDGAIVTPAGHAAETGVSGSDESRECHACGLAGEGRLDGDG